MSKNKNNNDINDEVAEYFKSLGYDVDWDTYKGIVYHEIFDKEGSLVLQIDKGTPLEAIKKDLIKERDNTGEGSGYKYTMNGAPSKRLDELLNKIK